MSTRKNKSNRNDLRNYTPIPVDMFNEIYKKYGNEDSILKIKEAEESVEYYVWTDFLVSK